MRGNYFDRTAFLVVASALVMLASTPAIAKDQSFEKQNTSRENRAAPQPSDQIIGEPAPPPQPETPISLEVAPANVQTLPEETTFEPSVRTVLRVLNDLGSVDPFN